MPFRQEYSRFLKALSISEVAEIKRALNDMIEGAEIHTAGWMPGANWAGTPFHPIYEKAARQDHGAAARCFGLFVWEVFMERPEVWTSGRFEKDGVPLSSRTYFRAG